eukprot:jgi/Mesen1/8015/ME000426S07169
MSIHMPPPRRLDLSDIENLKVAANRLFQEGKYAQAIIGYSYAVKQVQSATPAASKLSSVQADNPKQLALVIRDAGAKAQPQATLAAVLYSNRAAAYLRLEKFEKAAADADAAATLDPNNFKAWYRRAVAQSALKQYYHALVALKYALGLDPSSNEARQLLLEVQCNMGDAQFQNNSR